MTTESQSPAVVESPAAQQSSPDDRARSQGVRAGIVRLHDWIVARATPFNMGILALVVYFLSNNGQYMHFNYYMYLAESFLQGKLHIENPPPWLTEFTWHDGKRYLFYGPLPAVLLMPIVAVFHMKLNLAHACIAVGALDVALTWVVLERLGVSRKVTFWLTLIFAFGSVHYWVSEYGNNWLFSQVCALLFMLLAAVEALGKRRGVLVGLWLGASILSRNDFLLAVPFYVVALNMPKPDFKQSGWFFGGLALMGGLMAWYNWARFGNPLDNGYAAGEMALVRPPHGSVSLHYIVNMLPAYVWRGPTFQLTPPYVVMTDHGLSVFWTTPAFLFLIPAAAAFINRRPATSRWGLPPWSAKDWWMSAGAWAALLAIAFLMLCRPADGWRNFGARYSLDYTPFIIMVLGLYFKDRLPRTLLWLAGASIVINVWGVAYWRILNW